MPEEHTILDMAKEAVYGPRQEDYGHPRDNFTHTAALWTAYLQADYPEVEFSAEDVAAFMIMVKISRARNRPTQDTLVDIAGYAGAWDRVLNG